MMILAIPRTGYFFKALINSGAESKNVLSSLVYIHNCLEQSDLLAICKDHKEHKDKEKDTHMASTDSQVESVQMATQVALHHN